VVGDDDADQHDQPQRRTDDPAPAGAAGRAAGGSPRTGARRGETGGACGGGVASGDRWQRADRPGVAVAGLVGQRREERARGAAGRRHRWQPATRRCGRRADRRGLAVGTRDGRQPAATGRRRLAGGQGDRDLAGAGRAPAAHLAALPGDQLLDGDRLPGGSTGRRGGSSRRTAPSAEAPG
jgi:hypothetical protein